MPSKKTYEERIAEMDSKAQAAFEKAKQYEAQRRNLEKRKKEEDRRKRNRLLVNVGLTVEGLLDRPLEEEDNIRLMNFLKMQETNGRYFTKAMEKPILQKANSKKESCESSSIPEIKLEAPTEERETF